MTKTIKLSDFQIELQKTTAQNGLKFVHFKKPNSPIAIKIASRSGARFDPKGKEGLAHFLEHMIFNGTEKYSSKKDLSLVFDDIGGMYGASTGTEDIHIDFLVAKTENLDTVADVLDQIINKPLLLDKSIESEKTVIATEITSKLDTNKRILMNNMKTLLFGNDPVANNFSGTLDAINTINREDLQNHLQNIFPQDLTVISCGDCDIKDLVEKLSPVLPFKKLPNFVPAAIKRGVRYGSTKSENKMVHCKFAFPTCDVGSDEKVALKIIAQALGQGRSSILKEVLRYDSGLLYSVGAGSTYFSDNGYFQIDFSLKPENFNTIFKKITEAFTGFAEKGISEQTLNNIKNKIINSSTISIQTSKDWVEFHTSIELLIRDNNYTYADFLNEVNEITTSKVNDVAKKYLTKENAYFWRVGDTDEQEIKQFFSA